MRTAGEGSNSARDRVERRRQFLIYSRPLGRNFRILVTDNGIVMNECDGDSHFIQGKGLRPWLMVQNDDAPAVLHFRCLDNECTSTPPKPEAPPLHVDFV